MQFVREFTESELVFQICMNLEEAHTADAAITSWLPLVAELQPVSAEFGMADPGALRRGFLCDLLVALPLPERVPLGEAVEGGLRAMLDRLGAGGLQVVTPEEHAGREAHATGPGGAAPGYGPYGVYGVWAAAGYDPLNPEGGSRDYDDDEDL